jgi:hypothetical protein
VVGILSREVTVQAEVARSGQGTAKATQVLRIISVQQRDADRPAD